MGASGSVSKGSLFYEDAPNALAGTARTSDSLTGSDKAGRDHQQWQELRNPETDQARSTGEEIQNLVRRKISGNILLGKSLLTPCPPVENTRRDPGGKDTRSTIFDHVALPAPLPQSLCTEDISAFSDLALWEEHLRQTKPWLESQPVSTTASLISGISPPDEVRELDRARTNEQMLDSVARTNPSEVSFKSKKRGQTFVSLPTSRKNSLVKKNYSVHRPCDRLIVTGLGVLLSYLIEDPPDSFVKNQSWDIFSVPGDKTKVRRPVTGKERAKSAGSALIAAEDVSSFLDSLYKICKWTSECHIIAFILTVRCVHLSKGKVFLHRYNWQCLLVVSLMVSQKCWDDVSLNNVDFPQVWKMVAPKGGEIDLKDVNFMEREFLSILSYKVSVGMRLYTSCYYEIMSLALLSRGETSFTPAPGLRENNIKERYAMNQFYLVGNNVNKLEDEGEGESSEVEDLSPMPVVEQMEDAARKAHDKFKRRNTMDVLPRSPKNERDKRTFSLDLRRGRQEEDESSPR